MEKVQILQIMEYVMRILVIIIGAYGVDFIRKYNLEKWVRIAVSSAEQMTAVGLLNIPKKQYVIDFINSKFKLKINENELNALIEAVVKELNLLQQKHNTPQGSRVLD